MKLLWILLPLLSTMLAAETVHYDKAKDKKEIVHYDKKQAPSKTTIQTNRPNSNLYSKK